MQNITEHRINRLLRILEFKEDEFREQLDFLGVLSVGQLASRSGLSKTLANELRRFTLSDEGELRVNSDFVGMLNSKSQLHSFEKPVRDLRKSPLEKVSRNTEANRAISEVLSPDLAGD